MVLSGIWLLLRRYFDGSFNNAEQDCISIIRVEPSDATWTMNSGISRVYLLISR